MLIKKTDFLVDKVLINNGVKYIIKDDFYIGQVFNYLPHGIIDKTVTGIGGTSCELDAIRNSIVVQPYVFTAWSKAQLKTNCNKFNVHFYGREVIKESHPSKPLDFASMLKYFSLTEKEADLKLQEYMSHCKDIGAPIKITCVTDQVASLKKKINSIRKGLFEEFHFVLDEIDSVQDQSNYRQAMESCFEIYKKHPEERRTVISATVSKFHDPQLTSESLTVIEYASHKKDDITVVHITNPEEELIRQILKLYHTGGKIVIAYNHLDNIKKVIHGLIEDKTISSNNIKVLCSKSKISEFPKHFDLLQPDGKLPGQVNFITAAYFNGCDINESYHSIIIVRSNSKVLRHSVSTIYQISGRCRKKLLSNRLLVEFKPEGRHKLTEYSIQQLEENAKAIIDFDKFINKLRTSANPLTVKSADAIKNILTDGYEEYPSTNSIDEDGKLQISYLKIDKRYQEQETYKSYRSSEEFIKMISERFEVKTETKLYSSKSDKKAIKIDEVPHGLKLVEHFSSLPELSPNIIYSYKHNPLYHSTTLENLLLNLYNDAFFIKNIDFLKLSVELQIILSKAYYKSKLDKLKNHLKFLQVCDEYPLMKELYDKVFILGKRYSNEQVNAAIDTYILSISDMAITKSKKIRDFMKVLRSSRPNARKTIFRMAERSKKSERLWEVVESPFLKN